MPSALTRPAGVRWVNVGRRRIAAAHPPSSEALHSVLADMSARIEALYLESIGETPEGYRTDAPGIAQLLFNRDRSRSITEHGIRLLVDGFLELLGFGRLVQSLSVSLIRDANAGFDSMLNAQGQGKQPKASIYAINHRASTSEMGRYLDRMRRGNTDLIRKLVTAQVIKTETVLRESEGEHVKELSRRIREATGTSESHAELLARDQTLKLNADVTQFRARSLGADRYTWITSNDERVRGRPGGKWADSKSNHWKLHGKVFEFAKPPITNEEKGIRLNPGRDFQCRCIAVPDLSHVFE